MYFKLAEYGVIRANLAYNSYEQTLFSFRVKDCCGRDRMAVGLTTTYAISAYSH